MAGFVKGDVVFVPFPFSNLLKNSQAEGDIMECLYCGGQMERRLSSYTVDRQGYHLFLREIPAYICSQCGEKHFGEAEVEAVQALIRSVESQIESVQSTG
ncbi:MAG: YgiT-type zinc finger protein [Salinibacter sp.]